MDLSLQHAYSAIFRVTVMRFNPCFNGSFTSTEFCFWRGEEFLLVSILVLMDLSLQLDFSSFADYMPLSFNPCFNGSFTSTVTVQDRNIEVVYGFNPCFNGSFTSTQNIHVWKSKQIITSFNPCFNGSFTSTRNFRTASASNYILVSILVLMDLSLQQFLEA